MGKKNFLYWLSVLMLALFVLSIVLWQFVVPNDTTLLQDPQKMREAMESATTAMLTTGFYAILTFLVYWSIDDKGH